jgi:aspartate/methionine/tyrosine aminotransferase
MTAPDVASDTLNFLALHADLESRVLDSDSGNWLSGWQCDNPWIEEIQAEVDKNIVSIPQEKYHYLSDDHHVSESLRAFHEVVDGIPLEGLICGSGSTAIIFTFCAWLKERGVKEAYYIPPLYHTLRYGLNLFGIEVKPISSKHAFEKNFEIRLPDVSTILLFSDPIWYAGISMQESVIHSIIEWQKRTQSYVFVDGSFQYAKWSGLAPELSSKLDPRYTVRLICPTKALAAHGYRFSYAAVPAQIRQRLVHIYSNIYGSASVESLAFGRVSSKLMLDKKICDLLMKSAAERHKKLRLDQAIHSSWEANCGYFIYEKILRPLPNGTELIGGSYFEQKRYADHVRINLLSPNIRLLD